MSGTNLSVLHTSMAWSLIMLKDFTFNLIRIQIFKIKSQSTGTVVVVFLSSVMKISRL